MTTTGNNRSKGSNIEDKDNNLSRDSYKAEQTGEKIISRKIWKIWWVRILSVLASIVIFCTVYALILPAVAVTEEDAENGSGYYLENGEETPAVTEMAYNGSGEDAQMVNMNVDPVNDDFSGGNSVVTEAGSQDQGEEFSGSDDQNQGADIAGYVADAGISSVIPENDNAIPSGNSENDNDSNSGYYENDNDSNSEYYENGNNSNSGDGENDAVNPSGGSGYDDFGTSVNSENGGTSEEGSGLTVPDNTDGSNSTDRSNNTDGSNSTDGTGNTDNADNLNWIDEHSVAGQPNDNENNDAQDLNGTGFPAGFPVNPDNIVLNPSTQPTEEQNPDIFLTDQTDLQSVISDAETSGQSEAESPVELTVRYRGYDIVLSYFRKDNPEISDEAVFNVDPIDENTAEYESVYPLLKNALRDQCRKALEIHLYQFELRDGASAIASPHGSNITIRYDVPLSLGAGEALRAAYIDPDTENVTIYNTLNTTAANTGSDTVVETATFPFLKNGFVAYVITEELKEADLQVLAQPETTESEETQSETVQSEAEQPETVQSEAEQPEAVQSEAEQPETVQSEAEQPEAVQSEVEQPEAATSEESKSEETRSEESKAEETTSKESKAEETRSEESKAEETTSGETKAEGNKSEATQPEKIRSEDDNTLRITGGTAVKLTEVAPEIGIDSVRDVRSIDVEGSDYIQVTKEPGSRDWKIESVLPEENSDVEIKNETAELSVKQRDGSVSKTTIEISGEQTMNLTDEGTENNQVVVSSADGKYLPEEAQGTARTLTEEEGSDAVDRVKEFTSDDDTVDRTIEQKKSGKRKIKVKKKCYKVFDISLENVNQDDYDQFTVSMDLQESITGTDFKLYHIHDDEVRPLDVKMTSSDTDKSGQDVVSAIEFETPNFSQFVLSYTVEEEVEVTTYTYHTDEDQFDAAATIAGVAADTSVVYAESESEGLVVSEENPAADAEAPAVNPDDNTTNPENNSVDPGAASIDAAVRFIVTLENGFEDGYLLLETADEEFYEILIVRNTNTIISAANDNYSVTIDFGDSLPKGKYEIGIKQYSAEEEQVSLIEKALTEDLGNGKKKVAHVQDAELLDISILKINKEDGTSSEVEPDGPVKVTLQKGTEVLPTVVHFMDNGNVETLKVEEGNTFVTNSFSTFTGSYTVDFEYTDENGNVIKTEDINIVSGKNITLISVLEGLGINTDADNYISDAEVKNTDFVIINKEGEPDSWTVEFVKDDVDHLGEKAFLSITMSDEKQNEKKYDIVLIVTGQKEAVSTEGIASIAAVDGSYLPEEAEAKADVVTGDNEEAAVEKVEAAIAAGTTFDTHTRQAATDEGKTGEGTTDEEPKDKETTDEGATDGEVKDEENTNQNQTETQNDTDTQTQPQKQYRVFDISLNNVDTEAYEGGFKVSVSLPEEIRGASEFQLYHLHGNEEPKEIDMTTVGSVDEKTGLETVSGFEFVTDKFSEFVLRYTVDFHYNGVDYSIPGNTQILLTQLIETMQITVPENDEASGNDDAFDNDALLDIHDVVSVEFTDEHLVRADQVSGIITVNSVDGETTDVDAGDYNFLLSSLEPFSTEEKLTITLKDGTVIRVGVTDASSITITFYGEDGVTPETNAFLGSYNYLAWFNGWGGGVKGVAPININGSSATVVMDLNNFDNTKGDSFYLINYVGIDLDKDKLNGIWYYDASGNLKDKTLISNGTEIGNYILSDFANIEGSYTIKAVKKSGYTVNLEFRAHDYNGTTNPGAAYVTPGVTSGASAINEYSFVRVLLSDENESGKDVVVGYAITPIATSDSANSVIIDKFTMVNGGTMTYHEAKAAGYSVLDSGSSIRVGHKGQNQTPSYADFDNNTNGLSTGDYEGYTFAGQIRVSSDERTVRNRIADLAEYYVEINCGNDPLTLPSDVDIYALVKAETSTTTLYAYAKINPTDTTDGGKTYRVLIPETSWFQEQGWNSYQQITNQISGHETKVTVQLYGTLKTEEINDPGKLLNNNNEMVVGDVLQTHQVVSYPEIPKDYVSNTATGATQREIERNPGVKTIYTDYVYLAKNDDRMTDYSLETLLERYNIITIGPNTDSIHEYNNNEGHVTWGDGDFVFSQHTVGGILVRGDLIFKVFNSIGGGTQATQPSAVGGKVISECGQLGQIIGGGIGHEDRHNPFYVGEVNHIVDGKLFDGEGLRDINTYGPTIANNDYVDWDALQASIIRHSRAMEDSFTRTVTIEYEGYQTIPVQAGEKIKLVYTSGVNPEKTYITVQLDLMNQEFSTLPGTVISFVGGGCQYIPKLETINGQLPGSVDDGEGISVIYNYSEATALKNWDGNPEYGHVIAPFADIVLPGGNYNGCVIANSCYSGSEGHLSPYKGGTIVGFYGKLRTAKTVEGVEPTDRQVFKFVMRRLRNAVPGSECDEGIRNGKTYDQIMWDYIGAAMNSHSLVEFDKVPFYEAGRYYFLVYESADKQYPDITLDPVKYIVEVDVVANTSGENVVLSIDSSSLKYYIVTNEADLITVNQDTTTGAYHATVNSTAISSMTGVPTWDGSVLNTPIVFCNKAKKSGITIRKVVTDTDDQTAEFPFKLYVWFEETEDGSTQYIAYDKDVNANGVGLSFYESAYKSNSEDTDHPAGCVEFNLTASTPVTFVGLPVGAHYAFIEDVEGLTDYNFVSATNDTGVVPDTGSPSMEAEFTNRYISAKTHIEGKKVFTNGTIAANQFSFTLSGGEGHLPNPATVYSDAEGNITFGDMTYNLGDLDEVPVVNGKKTKTYTYMLTEVVPDGVTEQSPLKDNIKYDIHNETINVTVEYNTATHEMTATSDKQKAEVTFTNEQLGSLKVTKKVMLNGNSYTDHEALTFRVGLFENDSATTAIEGTVESITVAKDSSTGTVSYDGLTIGNRYYVFETDASGNKLTVGQKIGEYLVRNNGSQSPAIAINPVTVVVENEKEMAEFEFGKVWTTNGSTSYEEWPADSNLESIIVTLSRKANGPNEAQMDDQELTFEAKKDNLTIVPGGTINDTISLTHEVIEDTNNRIYKYKVSGLQTSWSKTVDNHTYTGKWDYSIKEISVGNGYREPEYIDRNGTKKSIDSNKTGCIIINDKSTISLPDTGSQGTRGIYITSIILLSFAAFGLLLHRRKLGEEQYYD